MTALCPNNSEGGAEYDNDPIKRKCNFRAFDAWMGIPSIQHQGFSSHAISSPGMHCIYWRLY